MSWHWSLLFPIAVYSVGQHSGQHSKSSIYLSSWNEDLEVKLNDGMLLQARSEVDMQRILVLKPDVNKSRPVLSVHLMNGLGNQLFQVSALLALALDSNARFSVALPNVKHVCCNRTTYWDSVLRKLRPFLHDGLQKEKSRFLGTSSKNEQSPLKSLKGTCQLEQLPRFDPFDKDCRKATVFNGTWASELTTLAGCQTVVLSGYFQNKRFFSKHLSFLQQLFWDDISVKHARMRLAGLVPHHSKPVVSIHYRFGDYEPNGWVLSDEYYGQGLLEVSRRLRKRPFCLIFSDDASRAWTHSNALDDCDDRALVPAEVDDVSSLYMMSLTEASILADSTFSYWAALLGQKWKQVVVAPQVTDRKADCWSYLGGKINDGTKSDWVMVPAARVSAEELFTEEVFDINGQT